MNLSEAWKTSRTTYVELVYRPILRSGLTARRVGTRKSVSDAVTGATINKLIFALFTFGGAIFPFLVYRLRLEGVAVISLTVAVALSVLLVFGYIVLYCVQVLPSFVSTGSFGPLSLLPLSRRETSLVSLMTLWRTLDSILIISLISEAAAVAYYTGSAPAVVLVTITSLSGTLLAVGTALWFTSIFQRRIEGTPGAWGMRLVELRRLFRAALFVLWGLGVMSVVFLFSLISFIAPPLDQLLASSGPPGLVLSAIFPFSAGLLASYFSGHASAGPEIAIAGLGVLVVAVAAAYVSFRASRTLGDLVNPVRARPVISGKRTGLSYSFRTRGPLPGYILKDLRVASRSPATAFLFALPVFEVLAVVVPITSTHIIRMSEVLVGVQVGGGFALFTAFLLVAVEDLGIERRTALPLSEAIRTLSKVSISILTYIPVPLALTVILATRASTFNGAIAVPVVATASIFAACVVEVSVLKFLGESGRGNAVRFVLGIGSGEVVLLIPAFAYSLEFILSLRHELALAVLVGACSIELLGSYLLLVAGGSMRRQS